MVAYAVRLRVQTMLIPRVYLRLRQKLMNMSLRLITAVRMKAMVLNTQAVLLVLRLLDLFRCLVLEASPTLRLLM